MFVDEAPTKARACDSYRIFIDSRHFNINKEFYCFFVNKYFISIMTEIIFIVEESIEGGFEAKALGASIFTEGETIDELKQNIKEAIHCHFEENAPKIVRLHYVKEEVFAA